MMGVDISILFNEVNHQLFQFHPELQVLCGGAGGRFFVGRKAFLRIVAQYGAIVV